MATTYNDLINANTRHRDQLLSEASELVTRSAGAALTGGDAARFEQIESDVREADARIAEWAATEQRTADIARSNVGPILAAMTDHQNAERDLARDPHPGVVGLARALVDGGFDLNGRSKVDVNGFKALGLDGRAVTAPAFSGLNPQAPALVPIGTDTRFLWPSLATQDAGDASSIQDFRQTARTVVGTVRRALDAGTDKATLDLTLTMVTEALQQSAVVIENIPNALFSRIQQLSAFLESEGKFQVYKDIDAHVFAQIVAATPPFGNTGTGLVAQVRNGIAAMRATGANPTLLVVNPTDAAALDLTADAGGYVFPVASSGSASPLWNLRVIERVGAGTEPPYLVDPTMLGVLYVGKMHFDADPFTGFKANLTNLRIEVDNLFHVRNANGARRIAAS